MEQRYYELAKNPDIIFYENEKPVRFEKYRKLSPAFIEDFDLPIFQVFQSNSPADEDVGH